MLLLIAGIIVFLGVHSVPMARGARSSLIAQIGEGGFKIAHSVLSVTGFVLIVWGFHRYRVEGWVQVWYPPVWTRHITITLMWFAFVSLACMNPAPGRIRGWLRHPMLVGVKIWALAHLLANGDLGGMILFGSFLAWAIADRISVRRRGDVGAARIQGFTRADAMALGIGTLAYGAMIALHPVLIGVSVIRG